MRVLKLTFLFLLIISCKQKKEEIKPELKTENQKSEIITQEVEAKIEMDSVYELYKKGRVEKYDWDLVSNKADKYRKVSEAYSDKKIIPNDFLEFSRKFISDSEFQKSHIDFENLIGVVGACEETYIMSKNNWVYDNWDFIENLEIDEKWENTFRFSNQVFFCEYELKEIGTIRVLGFEKQNGIWHLTLYDINDC
ncbi:hypothetical protein AWE51_25915 [Aquimarina aggregata]|uniref:Lipoprotein n=1 Tax=Aquimarina aggregata TaxID=1642818 RepID=A0A162Y781_9FLAO|nr:hypothetical protein [Aquimarina aggregata]KZS38966.1 hypothetical protein AWE51_25915 [Aquimarina aggregata]